MCRMKLKAGLDRTALECGAHWPSSHEATIALARASGFPNSLHNNCSGKHSGFLCTCVHAGIAHRGYVKAGHALQEMVRDAMQSVTGAAHDVDHCATDGCSTWTDISVEPLRLVVSITVKLITKSASVP